MKKFITMLLFAFALAFAVPKEGNAQLINLSVTSADDTLTNTQTGNLTTTVQGPRSVITFQLTITRVSGTAAGTAKLQGSIDNVHFHDIDGAFTITNAASQSTKWVVAPSPYTFYRINVAATGTGVLAPTGKALIRR